MVAASEHVMLLIHRWSVWQFVFNDAATPEIYTLPLPDALPISPSPRRASRRRLRSPRRPPRPPPAADERRRRSEEHTSELQSRQYLVCRLLLEKKITTGQAHAMNRTAQ